jgi:hypothetical protein
LGRQDAYPTSLPYKSTSSKNNNTGEHFHGKIVATKPHIKPRRLTCMATIPQLRIFGWKEIYFFQRF